MRGLCALVLALGGCAEGGIELEFRGGAMPPSVLLFSRTAGFRHGSIEPAIAALETEGGARGWTTTATEDPAMFDDATLADLDVVVFLLTTGDVLDTDQQTAFENFISEGKGYAGVHSATDTEYDWGWYGELLGGYFDGHPAPQDATVDVVDGTHASTAHLDAEWMRFDEWYNFAPDPAATVDVLLNLDESTYSGGTMGVSHPIAWTHEYGGGRAWYTGGGHTDASYAEPAFLEHLVQGIEWAAGGEPEGGSSDSSSSSSSSASSDETNGSTSPPVGTSSSGPDPGDSTESGELPPPGEGSEATGAVPATSGPADAPDDAQGCACRGGGATATLHGGRWSWLGFLILVAGGRGCSRRYRRRRYRR